MLYPFRHFPDPQLARGLLSGEILATVTMRASYFLLSANDP
jgi:hypothetical protein